MKTTMTKAYAGAAIPLGALLLASAIGGSGGSAKDQELDYDVLSTRDSDGYLAQAKDYERLGKYNPCILIECEGE
jgi:hypothetical protein